MCSKCMILCTQSTVIRFLTYNLQVQKPIGSRGHLRPRWREFGPQVGNEAEEIVKDILTKDINLYEVCCQIRSCMDYSQRLQLYHSLYHSAHATDRFRARSMHSSVQAMTATIAFWRLTQVRLMTMSRKQPRKSSRQCLAQPRM